MLPANLQGISPSSLAPDSGSDSNAEVLLVAATLVQHPKVSDHPGLEHAAAQHVFQLCVDKVLSKLPSESAVAQASVRTVGVSWNPQS